MMSQPATSKLGKYEHIWKSPGLSQHLKLEQTSLQKGKGDNLKLLNILKLPSSLLFSEERGGKWQNESLNPHKPTHLTHLQLKDPPLLLHLFCDLCAGDLGADHAVLLGMFPLLLLNLCAMAKKTRNKRWQRNNNNGYRKWLLYYDDDILLCLNIAIKLLCITTLH